jgi:Fe2+ or Zn2+ uptake regulation protein
VQCESSKGLPRAAQVKGIRARQHFEEGRAVFELTEGRHHDHMVCLRCGKVQEFFDAAIEQRQRELAEQYGLPCGGLKV